MLGALDEDCAAAGAFSSKTLQVLLCPPHLPPSLAPGFCTGGLSAVILLCRPCGARKGGSGAHM